MTFHQKCELELVIKRLNEYFHWDRETIKEWIIRPNIFFPYHITPLEMVKAGLAYKVYQVIDRMNLC